MSSPPEDVEETEIHEAPRPSRERFEESRRTNDEDLWKSTQEVKTKDREEEFDDYLADLLL
jgi:hypothetical protein